MTFTRLILTILLFASTKIQSQIPREIQHTVWEQEGYDRILKINDSTYSYFNSNKYLCSELVAGAFEGRFNIVEFNDNQLVLNPGGIVNYRFKKINYIPKPCVSKNKQEENFEINFKSFWETFNRNYAFFEKRGLDWENVYKEYLPIVRKLKTQEEFALTLREIIEKFNDGHIRLEVPDSVLKIQNTVSTRSNSISKEKILLDIANRYINSLGSYNNGVINWGILENENIGYISISDMNNFANYVPNEKQNSQNFDSIYGQNQNQVNPLDYFRDEIHGVNFILPKIKKDFTNINSVIIDLRFNGGGYETVALEILEHFVGEKKKIFSIKAKTENDFTPIQDYTLKPKAKDDKKIYLLISPFTASAAEIFVLASLPYPNIKKYGSRTAGIFSEILWKELPIGWEYSLSNEVYLEPNGNSYEGEGIPVDYELSYSKDKFEFFKSFYSNNEFYDIAIEKIIKTESKK